MLCSEEANAEKRRRGQATKQMQKSKKQTMLGSVIKTEAPVHCRGLFMHLGFVAFI